MVPFFGELIYKWGTFHHRCGRLCTGRILNRFILGQGLEKASQRKEMAFKLHLKEREVEKIEK